MLREIVRRQVERARDGGMPTVQLARMASVRAETISRWTRGRRKSITTEQLERLMRVLDLVVVRGRH